ncbi:MAG: hypothetical protein KIT80_17820 [Chitinophagaceae bacterium]|nr:hypothetical protein [Chitinophagaceae bacterium]MCW5928783.1 hypothetical protein [Chitinophagaceae bacterium]
MVKYNSLIVSFFICVLSFYHGKAQDFSKGYEIIEPSPNSVVKSHKDNLRLTLVIDSIIVGNKKILPNFRSTISIKYESEFIKVKDDLYIKIFIARNQEYGKKFYSWKWDYLRKVDGKYRSLGISSYEVLYFNQEINPSNSLGHGVGFEEDEDFIMYFYRYKLE